VSDEAKWERVDASSSRLMVDGTIMAVIELQGSGDWMWWTFGTYTPPEIAAQEPTKELAMKAAEKAVAEDFGVDGKP